jgi:hypothetical protein
MFVRMEAPLEVGTLDWATQPLIGPVHKKYSKNDLINCSCGASIQNSLELVLTPLLSLSSLTSTHG